MQILEQRRKKPIINITSLIDVLFLLLIFFMVSSTFKEQPGMKLELPESQTFERTEIKDLVLQIESTGDGEPAFALNAQPVSLDSLPHLLKIYSPQTTDKTLTIKADRRIQHGVVVNVMDIAKQTGFKKLIIATRIKPE